MSFIDTQVVTEPIEPLLPQILEGADTHGAVNLFIGRVRSLNLGRQVRAVEYDCHPVLCKKIFAEIAHEAQQCWWPDARIRIVHRHGRLKVGDISVAVVATTGHRDESYKITRYTIEAIKQRAPIWKKEFYSDGESEWVKGHALCQHSHGGSHDEDTGHSSCWRQVVTHGPG